MPGSTLSVVRRTSSRRRLFTVLAAGVVAVTVSSGVSSAAPSTTPTPTPTSGITQPPSTTTPTPTPSQTPQQVETRTTQTPPAEPTPQPGVERRRPAETSTTPTQTTAPPIEPVSPSTETTVQPNTERTRAPAGDWRPTENPNATIKPGQMRSDREEIPAGATKEMADKAETMEAAKLQSRTTSLTAGCQVYWPFPYEVCGAIKDKYNSLGGPGSFLSYPNSNELTNPGNTGKRTQFLNGPIYWSAATGAHPVVNSFLNRWGIHGYEGGWLKYPTTDEIVLPDGGRRQEFQGGAIYVAFQNAIGSAIRNGPLRDKYNSVGGLAPGGTLLGYPIQDQIGLPDGQGQMDRFQNGVIYWHPSHGARVVSGTVLQDWAAAGYESGTYGYPTADAVQTSDIWYEQQFQNGKLAGTIVINRGLYWPLISVDRPTMPGDNYESDVLPCMEYEIEADQPLAVFRVRGVAAPIFLYCGRFRTHMAPNPAVSGNPGHFSNYPPTRKDWYDFLGCTFYTFTGENYPNVDSGNFGRQRGNVSSGVNSVSVGNEPSGTFVTGWAGQNQYSSQWSGCVQGLILPWE